MPVKIFRRLLHTGPGGCRVLDITPQIRLLPLLRGFLLFRCTLQIEQQCLTLIICDRIFIMQLHDQCIPICPIRLYIMIPFPSLKQLHILPQRNIEMRERIPETALLSSFSVFPHTAAPSCSPPVLPVYAESPLHERTPPSKSRFSMIKICSRKNTRLPAMQRIVHGSKSNVKSCAAISIVYM